MRLFEVRCGPGIHGSTTYPMSLVQRRRRNVLRCTTTLTQSSFVDTVQTVNVYPSIDITNGVPQACQRRIDNAITQPLAHERNYFTARVTTGAQTDQGLVSPSQIENERVGGVGAQAPKRRPRSAKREAAVSTVASRMQAIALRSSRRIVSIRPLKS